MFFYNFGVSERRFVDISLVLIGFRETYAKQVSAAQPQSEPRLGAAGRGRIWTILVGSREPLQKVWFQIGFG